MGSSLEDQNLRSCSNEGKAKMMARAFVLLLITLMPITRTASDTRVPNAELVSLVRLIATPERYDGKVVLVVGFLRLEFEGNGLYVHEEDYKRGITKNAVWVVRNAKVNDRADALNMHYVMLVGTFDASRHGHMDLFSGSLTNITSVTLWPPRPKEHNPSSE